MKKPLIFTLSIIAAITVNIAAWYIAEGLIWFKLTMKPYTPVGASIMTWIAHIVVQALAILLSVLFVSTGWSDLKVKKQKQSM